jgi:hypothetical protein
MYELYLTEETNAALISILLKELYRIETKTSLEMESKGK